VMYAYPNRFPWELTTLLREHPRVIPYLDIPVQHIATPVLRAMRRAGGGDQVRHTLDRLRAEVPGITLRTTLLVGFPGETDADVEELVDFIGEYELGRLGAFTFSSEEGTPAHGLPDPVPDAVMQTRQTAVLEARDRALRTSQASWVGREVEVLIDEVHATRSVGRTAMDAPEVDPLAILRTPATEVGERVLAQVLEVDEEFNLICSRTS